MLKILLVDDSLENRELLKLFLKKHEVEVTEARNGKEAVEKCSSETFDLILMDMQMPILNGAEAMAAIRNDYPDYNDIPFVALTAYSDTEEREHCFSLGFNEYMSKPIDRNQFDLLIEKFKV